MAGTFAVAYQDPHDPHPHHRRIHADALSGAEIVELFESFPWARASDLVREFKLIKPTFWIQRLDDGWSLFVIAVGSRPGVVCASCDKPEPYKLLGLIPRTRMSTLSVRDIDLDAAGELVRAFCSGDEPALMDHVPWSAR
jgi:hypothetical protein